MAADAKQKEAWAEITTEDLLAVNGETELLLKARDVLTALAVCLIDADQREILDGGRASAICPICGGTIDYSIAPNGHLWGACRSRNCVRWMQ